MKNEEEWKKFLEEDLKNLEETGGKHILAADCFWSDGECALSTVSEWPDIEAYQKHATYEAEHEWPKYFDLKFYLGTHSELRWRSIDHYGAVAIGKPDDSLEACRLLGKRLFEHAEVLKAGLNR